jgi:protein tyrosine phosphatase (PTP) superfamily phosphohydrolase (DUF442 family)
MAACLGLPGSWVVGADDKPAPRVEKAEIGKMPYASSFADLYFGGQPSPEDLKVARDKGIKAVLNLRAASELDYDEGELVRKLGLKYHHVPFQGPDMLTDEIFEKVRAILKDKGSRPLLFHCASANRVGAVWLAHRVLDHKVGFDEALKEARTIGLRTPAYVDRARSYIDRKQK